MTKIKNTKKGMAKKTLSMSLVVAMLATSNVPVWAAEFGDGTEATFTSEAEAPVVEEEVAAPVVEDNTNDAVDAQATGDTWTVKLTDMPTEVEWADTKTKNVTVEVKDVDGKVVVGKDDKGNSIANSGLSYVWKDAATGLAVSNPANVVNSIETPAVVKNDATGETVGKQYVLYIYDESGDWTYTSAAFTVGAKDISNAYTIGYKGTGDSVSIDGDRPYTGEETSKNAVVTVKTNANADANVKFEIDYTGDLVNAGAVNVTARPVDTKLYKGVISGSFNIEKTDVSSTLIKSTLVTKEFPYTGVAIAPAKTDVNVTDAKTGDDLNDIVESITATSAKEVGDTSSITATVKAKSTTKNYKENSTCNITTADTFKVVARDLSTVKVVVDSQVKDPSGAVFTAAKFNEDNVHFYDAAGNKLELFNSVDITVPANASNFGTYTLTFKPKTLTRTNTDGTTSTYTNVTGQTTAQFSIYSQSIEGATFSAEIADQEYTGSQVKPDVSKLKVTLGGKEVDPADYTIEYGENVKADDDTKTGHIYIVGKRTYEGSKADITFKIKKAVVTNEDLKAAEYVIINKDAKTAGDYAKSIGLVVKAKNGATPAKEFTLTEGTDYTVTYAYDTENKVNDTITATITLKSESNFKMAGGTTSLTTSTRIANPIISDSDIKMNQTSYEYTGAVIVPDFSVVVNGKTLKKDTDYVIDSVVGSAKVGTATVYIKGAGEYDDQVKAKATFTVTPASAEKTVVTVTKKNNNGDIVYNGEAKKADAVDVKVTLNGNVVTDQFDVTYGENINAGEKAGTVTVTPKKDNQNFTAGTSQTGTFEIKAATLTGVLKVYDERGIEYTVSGDKLQKNGKAVSFDYDGTEKTFAKVVFTPEGTLAKYVTADDYEIKYLNNVTGGGDGACVVVLAKGNFAGGDTVDTVSDDNQKVTIKNVAKKLGFTINSKLYFTEKEVTVTDAEYAGSNMLAAPTIVVKDGNKVLKEGTDYTVKLTYKNGSAIETGVNAIGTYNWEVTGAGVYADLSSGKNQAKGEWKVTKKDVANLDITVDLDANGEPVLTVMNGNLKVDNKNFTVTLSDDKKTATVAATTGNKYYIGSKEIELEAEDAKVGQAIISDVVVNGNTVTPVLSSEADDAVGYDYVLATENNVTDGRIDISKNILSTHTNFYYVPEGTYYVYCHAWKRGEDGKKVFGEWSNIKEVKVEAKTPSTPTVVSATVKGNTVTVTYTESEDATGYDVVLGTSVKSVNGERRPVEYGKLVKKNVEAGTVTVTFTNVPAGTYYAGLHAYNRTSANGSKVFSKWSPKTKTAVVK